MKKQMAYTITKIPTREAQQKEQEYENRRGQNASSEARTLARWLCALDCEKAKQWLGDKWTDDTWQTMAFPVLQHQSLRLTEDDQAIIDKRIKKYAHEMQGRLYKAGLTNQSTKTDVIKHFMAFFMNEGTNHASTFNETLKAADETIEKAQAWDNETAQEVADFMARHTREEDPAVTELFGEQDRLYFHVTDWNPESSFRKQDDYVICVSRRPEDIFLFAHHKRFRSNMASQPNFHASHLTKDILDKTLVAFRLDNEFSLKRATGGVAIRPVVVSKNVDHMSWAGMGTSESVSKDFANKAEAHRKAFHVSSFGNMCLWAESMVYDGLSALTQSLPEKEVPTTPDEILYPSNHVYGTVDVAARQNSLRGAVEMIVKSKILTPDVIKSLKGRSLAFKKGHSKDGNRAIAPQKITSLADDMKRQKKQAKKAGRIIAKPA